jgi:antitoxin component YwqK of YwqJK toxin-antitoxin module
MHVPIRSLSVAMIAVCSITASFAQPVVSTSYLDRDYHPASERSYAFKRVIKYTGEIYNTRIKMDKDYLQHVESTPSGVHTCSLTDYFPSGEPALVANLNSRDMLCKEWWFDGKVVYFYRSGRIRRTEFYNLTKLQGEVITYAEDGRILTKEHYEGGQLIDNRGYAVGSKSSSGR